METDELRRIWSSGKEANGFTRAELEHTFHKVLTETSEKLQRRIRLDLLVAFILVVTIVLSAYLAGFRYWPGVGAWMSGFSLILILGYRLHLRALSFPPAAEDSLLSMTRQVKRRISILSWGFRLAALAAIGILYSFIVMRFGLLTFTHLWWILPLSALLTEGVIRLMYGQAIGALNKLLNQIEQTE